MALTEGARPRGKILEFRGLGGPGRPENPSKKVGGFALHLFEGFPCRPGPPRPRKSKIFPLSLAPLLVPPPCEGRSLCAGTLSWQGAPLRRSAGRQTPESQNASAKIATATTTQAPGDQRCGTTQSKHRANSRSQNCTLSASRASQLQTMITDLLANQCIGVLQCWTARFEKMRTAPCLGKPNHCVGVKELLLHRDHRTRRRVRCSSRLLHFVN